MTKKMILIKDSDRSFTLNVLIAALHAMERRSDVSARELNHYRALLARETTTFTIAYHGHGDHWRPSNVCDCYYGLVS